jgi:hypothetical protein
MRVGTADTARDGLDQLDQRVPLPLLPVMAQHQKENMRDHLVAVQQIVAATSGRDFSGVAEAARRLGYSESKARMCEHLGAAAPGFTDLALTFHHTADGIAEAAERADERGVLDALGATLTLCTKCHATYKQKLVEKLPE